MPMNARLLRPLASGVHPDAADWRARVVANGGTVSGSTLQAVSRFCASISAAGIRDRFYRLNLFCGSSDASLNAVRTPLYRGQSTAGTQYGNTTDTNYNFVAGDYAENSGLLGDGSTKYLDTGVPMNFTTPRDIHLSSYVEQFVSGSPGLVGADTSGDGVSPRFFQALLVFGLATRVNVFYNYGTVGRDASSTANYQPVLLLGQATASGGNLYANGTSVATHLDVGAGTNSRQFPLYVFAVNNRDNSVGSYANSRMSTYSVGLSMTSSQVTAYQSALDAFRSSLGRS